MFEFLRECNHYSIYERACGCEKIVGDVLDVMAFRAFSEAAIRSIYHWESKMQAYAEKRDYFDLLNDSNVIDTVVTKYHFNDIRTLNIIRVKGNSVAHGENPDHISDDMRERMFKCIYKLAACIYNVRTGKTAPALSNEEVKSLIHRKIDDKDIQEIKTMYEAEINAIQDELSRKDEIIAEKDQALSTALYDANIALKDAASFEREKNDLTQKLKQEKYKNINQDELNTKQMLIAEKDSLISRYEGDIKILENRLSNAEKSQNDEQITKLKEKNTGLSDNLKLAISEREEYKHQLEELAENTCDKYVVEDLRNQVEALENQFNEKNKLYEQAKRELELERGKQITFSSPISTLQEMGYEYARQIEVITDLEDERRSEIQRINSNSPYKCKNCGKKLVLTKYENAWRCENYMDEKEKNLPSAYTKLSERDKFLFQSVRIIDDRIKEKETEKNNWLNEYMPENKGSTTPIKASDYLINQNLRKEIEFKEYPDSITQSNPKSAIFQTITVPSEIFNRKDELNVKQYNKFRVWFGDMLASNKYKTSKEERTIYSLVLRLLNRGFVLKSSEETEMLLRSRFDEGNYGDLNKLIDYIEYENPVFINDSEYEREFAAYYFPRVLGKSWASYVTSQVSLDELLPDSYNNYKNCRANFLVSGYSKEIKPIIIEIDGYENKQAAIFDEGRRLALKNKGYEVLSFKKELVECHSDEIIEELKTYFDVGKKEQIIEVNNKYMLACKLQHQFAIAITKSLEMGYIQPKSHFNAYVSTTLLNNADIAYILSAAIIEVERLISRFCELYGITIDCVLNDGDTKAISINVGDGEPGFNDITIRDNYFIYDYLCKLEKFDASVIPQKAISDDTLLFFIKYIFGHNEFRTGQLNAIKRLLYKSNSIVLLPTGAGKSIIYQLSSFLVPGMIVVISPLKSLINDQVANLELRCGISNAISIVSRQEDKNLNRRRRDLRQMKCNSTSLLYISPERLQIPDFRNDVKEMLETNNVFAVAIDEAHCVSEWGHDFRPSYLVIGKNSRMLFSNGTNEPTIIALTGTASSKVRQDIQRTLQIPDERAVLYPDTFERNELIFSIVECKSDEKIANISYMLREDIPELFNSKFEDFNVRAGDSTNSGVIFTPFTRGRSKQYAAQIVEQTLRNDLSNVRTATYFSKAPQGWDLATWEANILENAKLFRENQINFLVVTKAFGMGIDKGNIRYTIHDGIPQSIEAFYQEAGRAGRDGNNSYCMLLFSDDDKNENIELLNPQLDIETLRNKYVNSNGTDDVNAQLYFHLKNFRGINKECETLNKIIDLLPYKYRKGQGINISKYEQCFDNEENRDNGKSIAQAIVRLLKLGIVDDYQYEYGKGNYIITLGSLERNDIDQKFEDYVKSFNAADVANQGTLINAIPGNDKNAVKQIAKLLISYTYEQIESGRRRQLITIYEMIQKVAPLNREEQCAVIRDEINKYFALPANPKNDPIGAIIESADIRIDIAMGVFDIKKDKVTFTDKEKKKATEIAGRAGRELESVSTRPDLILLKDLAQIVSGEYSKRGLANDLTAVDRFAREKYNIEPAVLNDVFIRIYNLVISTDIKLFDEIIKEMAKYRKVLVKDLLAEIMTNTGISYENRDYLVMCYYKEKIYHLL